MSLIKGKRQINTILDFSNEKASRNKIKEALRLLRITDSICNQNSLTIFDHVVKVGSFNIKLILHENYDTKYKRLRDFGRFKIRVFEGSQEIYLKKDYRFKGQNWAQINNNFRISDLIETILYINRLHMLRCFL